MKRSPDYYHNRKLLKELAYDSTKYRPTVGDIKEWFVILNQQIFGNKLSEFDEIRIGRPRGVHALFLYWPGDKEKGSILVMTKVFSSKKEFVEILAHEMIHLFQHTFNEPLGHGPSFRAWSDNLQLKGLKLYRVA
jgi:hypothetical protein